MTETKPCPKCERKMIKVYGDYIICTLPPLMPVQWKCGCGYTEDAGIERDMTPDELFMERWNKANE